jgi:hypothetical protein
MATPYFPEDLGEEDPHRVYVIMSRTAYELVEERAGQLGIDKADMFLSLAANLLFWLSTELLNGSRLLIERGDEVTELAIPHPSRPGQPLVEGGSGTRSATRRSPSPPPVWWPSMAEPDQHEDGR